MGLQDGKRSNEDDILPDGHKIKKGDGISYMPYAMGRMTYVWGEDAEVFRPERWLHNGVFRSESPFKFTAFQVIIICVHIIQLFQCTNFS